MDELLKYSPEPCPTCDTGLHYMLCYDGVYRCRNCVGELARRNGWDEMTVCNAETVIEAVSTEAQIHPRAGQGRMEL